MQTPPAQPEPEGDAFRAQALLRLISALGHDVRQPLHAIGLFLELLGRRDEDKDRARIRRSIKTALNGLEEMVDAVTTVAKLETGRVQPVDEPVMAQELFVDLEGLCAATALARRLRFKLWYPQHPVSLQIDRKWLLALLHHALIDALETTVRGGVLLALRPWQGGVVFEVHDTRGSGGEITLPAGADSAVAAIRRQLVSQLCAALGLGYAQQIWPGRGCRTRLHIPVSTTT